MNYRKIKELTYYLGAVAAFGTFVGIEVYNKSTNHHIGQQGKLESTLLGIHTITLLPLGMYLISKTEKTQKRGKDEW